MNNTIPKRSFMQKFHVKGILWVISLIVLLFLSSAMTGVNLTEFFNNLNQFADLLVKMSNPDWQYMNIIIQPIIETIQMALLGTTLGAIVAVPFSVIAARNIVKNPFIRGIVRLILNLVRTFPNLLLAALFVAVVGIGPTAGVFTLAIFSFGMVSKLFYETVEAIDDKPLDALKATGANKIQVIIYSVIPQVLNRFIDYFLYTFEINVRSSTVLGYLGAGGIGVYLQRSLSSFMYNQTSVIIITILVVVIVIDGISNILQEKLK
ncbi:phosphonate ABC transporter, permease protein PhnE [Apilactobacillus apisilvae]|uniref:Phosphonate ABC transporter, permease protein PhnE n=1 Tax=Apilactobacillus apisilvae TaxID=2923364 RepID=A0ABY4PGU6_9LACO|nr:phosphonate ABC transporter, permease protein PhnE [Apilactobacillus apisilvae]UQS84865.1 phosphonate ABC transporter, permease protein PhnE [Apilactobacillus apisilvae]